MKILDNSNFTSKDNWVITLIRYGASGRASGSHGKDEHAMIVIEGKNERGEVVKTLVDFGAPSSKFPSYGNCDLTANAFPCTTSKVSFRSLPAEKEIKYFSKSDSWVVPKANAENLIKKAEGDSRATQFSRPGFSIFGRYNFLNSLHSSIIDMPYHNCVTWSIETLKHAGIVLDARDNANLWTTTTSIQKRSALGVSLVDLFHFAAKGDADSIRMHFKPGSINVNILLEGAYLGSVASYLGHYSPLMLAASYGREDTVKVLVEEYGADINFLGGRFRDNTALDCAKKDHWFGESKGKKAERSSIQSYLLEKGALTGSSQRRLIQDLCKAAYHGRLDEIKRILTQHPGVLVTQTVSDALMGWSFSYLGVYSPLMCAVIGNRMDVVRYLVEECQDNVNLLNGRGLDHTALEYAVHDKHDQIRDFLRENNGLSPEKAKSLQQASDNIMTVTELADVAGATSQTSVLTS